MDEHFRLDVDPEGLRSAARELRRMARQVDDSGRAARSTPGEIGDGWVGDAADKVKAEMSALGSAMVGFHADFVTSAEALDSLAQDYEDALKQVAGMNQRWADAQDAYEAASQRAESQYQEAASQRGPDGRPLNRAIQMELRDSRQHAIDQAADDRRSTQHGLEYGFGMMKQWLAQQTRGASQRLVDHAPFEVTSDQVGAWSGTGAYPVRFDRSSMWETLALAGEAEELALTEAAEERAGEDVARLNELLETQPLEDPDALTSLLQQIGADAEDPYYAEAVTRALGPDGLNKIYDSLDGYLAMNMGEGHRPEDFWPGIEALNDVVANGLTRYNDADLVNFVGEYAGPMGGPSRLALVLGSDYADGRLNGLGLVYATRMGEQKYQPGTMWTDVANRLQYKAFPDGPDAMIRGFADRTDTDALAQVLHNAGEDAVWIAEGLLDTGERTRDGILHQDVWAAKQQVVLDVLARSMDEHNAGAVEALFTSLTQHNSYYTEDLMAEVADVVGTAERMRMLAAESGSIDAEVVARVADRVMEDVDLEELVAGITETGLQDGDGARRIAEDLGYVLGLSDAADISVDNSGVLKAVVGSLAGAAGKASGVAGPAVSILTAMLEAQEEADKKFETYGENWSREQHHRLLAWAVYVGHHGAPSDYDAWLEQNQDRIPTDSPDRAVELYIQHLRDSDSGTPGFEAWEELDELMEQIGNTRRIGDVD